MDLKFTSHFEEELDDIETGKCKYADVLDEFWGPFSEDAEASRRRRCRAVTGRETGEKCPKCGRPLVKQYSAKTGGDFLGCSGWKDKENPVQVHQAARGRARTSSGRSETDIQCPACGKHMVKKSAASASFFSCSGVPGLPRTTMNLGADGKPIVTALPTEDQVPEVREAPCSAAQESKAGKQYVQCPDPKCKFDLGVRRHRANPIKPPDTGIVCEKCGSPMVVKKAGAGRSCRAAATRSAATPSRCQRS